MSVFDYDAFDAAPLRTEPYEHIVVPGFVRRELRGTIARDYPEIQDTGSHPIESLHFGPGFEAFWKDVQSDEFRRHFERLSREHRDHHAPLCHNARRLDLR